jgi:hypothetical protein
MQISAGEQIDLMFGAKLGLSSMMAAGLGNTVADVVGINISHTIEVSSSWEQPNNNYTADASSLPPLPTLQRKFKRMKSMAPALTKAQLALPRTQRGWWCCCEWHVSCLD